MAVTASSTMATLSAFTFFPERPAGVTTPTENPSGAPNKSGAQPSSNLLSIPNPRKDRERGLAQLTEENKATG